MTNPLDRHTEADIKSTLDQLDGQLGGQNPTTLDYRPSSTGEVVQADIERGLEPLHPAGMPPTPDMPEDER